MKTKLGLLLIISALVTGCSTVSVQESQTKVLAATTDNQKAKMLDVSFVSYDPFDTATAAVMAPKPVTVTAKLHIPAGKGPFPAVVVANSSAGRNDRVSDNLAVDLSNNGYAVLAIQSLEARGSGPSGTNQLKVTFQGPGVDALYALEYLRTLPIIKADRICVAGHSRGGQTSFNLTYFESFISMSGFKGKPFDCNISIISGGHIRPKDDTSTGKPALVLLGEKDDVWYNDENLKWIASLNTRGANIKVVTLKDTYHGLTTDKLWCPTHQTVRGCKTHVLYDKNGNHVNNKLATRAEGMKTCGSYGYHCAYGSFNMYPTVLNNVLGFLNDNIGKK